jgi:uncharacterized protein
VSDLWRFPVKSFGGERLRRVFVGPFGVIGDRRYAVMDEDGPMSARRNHALLGFRARYENEEAAEGAIVRTPSGQLAAPDAPAIAQELEDELGHPVAVDGQTVGFFDAAPLHVLSEASLQALAAHTGDDELDRRRFRANILVDIGERPFGEDSWIGRRLSVGGALIEVVVNTERCAVTTFDPDTLERRTEVLAALAKERENLFGVYARVLRPGWVAVGDPISPG